MILWQIPPCAVQKGVGLLVNLAKVEAVCSRPFEFASRLLSILLFHGHCWIATVCFSWEVQQQQCIASLSVICLCIPATAIFLQCNLSRQWLATCLTSEMLFGQFQSEKKGISGHSYPKWMPQGRRNCWKISPFWNSVAECCASHAQILAISWQLLRLSIFVLLQRPLLFPLSNPASSEEAECSAEDAYQYTEVGIRILKLRSCLRTLLE